MDKKEFLSYAAKLLHLEEPQVVRNTVYSKGLLTSLCLAESKRGYRLFYNGAYVDGRELTPHFATKLALLVDELKIVEEVYKLKELDFYIHYHKDKVKALKLLSPSPYGLLLKIDRKGKLLSESIIRVLPRWMKP